MQTTLSSMTHVVKVGPFVGGMLSQPAKHYPGWFGKSQFWINNPYLLPCLFGALVSAIGFLLGYWFLEETVIEESVVESAVNEETSLLTNNTSSIKDSRLSYLDVLRSTSLPLICTLPMTALCEVMNRELFSLWSVSPIEKGGLSFTTKDVGFALMFVGIIALLIPLLVFAPLQKRVGSVTCYSFGMVCYCVYFFLIPKVSLVARQAHAGEIGEWGLWGCLLSVMAIGTMGARFSFTSSTLLVNHSGRKMNALGTVNGVSQFLGGVARTTGPFLGGTIWSWSTGNNLSYPFDFHFTFHIMGCFCFIGVMHSIRLFKVLEKHG
jgi:hypothetical protein